MDADFSVELGPPAEEATLEMPWDSGLAHGPRYLDLKREPELLHFITEAANYPELAELLQTLNSKASLFETAKCDVWLTDELSEDEEIYGAAWKVGCYVDLVFSDEQVDARFSFFHHEELTRALVERLKRTPDIPASAEFIVRRCFYHVAPGPSVRDGFYVTAYVFAYGDDADDARQRWQLALRLLGEAALQVSAQMRTH